MAKGWLSQDAKRVAAWTAALMTGAVSFGVFIFQTVRQAHGTPVSPTDTLSIVGYLFVLTFLASGFRVLLYERSRAEAANQAIRDMRRAEEQRRFFSGKPTGLKIGQLERLVWQVRTPDLLDEKSNKLLGEMIAHCIAGLNRDAIYIIQRERFTEMFGPFDSKRGRYGRLTWADASAEATHLIHSGMLERVPDDPTKRLRWTSFGYAVMGRLGRKLDWWRGS
jgi:hypothetical protein